MSKSLSKNALITEIAVATNLDKTEVADVLNKLTDVAYREAINGFIIPGICKLKVVTKKASHYRNPATGKLMLIGERQTLKAIPISKAKEIITPKVENLIQVIDETPPVEKKSIEENKPVEEKPIAEIPSTVSKPITDALPPFEKKTVEEVPPPAEKKPLTETSPLIEKIPIADIPPPVEKKPMEGNKPVEEKPIAEIPSTVSKPITDALPPFEKKTVEEAPSPAEKKPLEEEPKEEQFVSKMPEGSVPPFPDLHPLPSPAATTEEPESPSPQPSPSPSMPLGGEGGQIVFNCISCGTMLAVPPTSAGNTCTCPFCSVMNLIPSRKKDSDGTTTKKSETARQPETTPKTGADFITFVCQTCGQEIEAPIDMMGMDASCPTCASSLHVPASFTAEAPDEPVAKPAVQPAPGSNMSSMTIRIDLSDLE